MTELDIKPFGLFADLTDPEREAVAALIEVHTLDDGEPLYGEGQEADGLILVAKGELVVSSLRSGALGRLGPGESLGAASLVAVGSRETSAEASGDTTVFRLSRESFRRLAVDEPAAGVRVLEAVLLDLTTALRRNLDILA